MTREAGALAMRQESVRRLFFAIWPDDATRARLAEAVREFVPAGTGRPQRPDQWHVTLEFLGDVPEPRLQGVLDSAATAAREAFACELEFDRLQHWKRPQVLCLAAGLTPGPLAALVQLLRAQLRMRGFAPESRPFKPHVTLARRVRQAPPPADGEMSAWSLHWPVSAFALVQSVTGPEGARYIEVACWPTGS
ncbi:MAG: RNA 2',3'-cyclic phosphodiesterase [Steroidobacteraceae bacterium]|nr:RNA 2',3'-cyclic phosphodiesterase [Steroidobacteraceae bacterium]